MERTLVLGGGFGGIAVATGLRERKHTELSVATLQPMLLRRSQSAAPRPSTMARKPRSSAAT